MVQALTLLAIVALILAYRWFSKKIDKAAGKESAEDIAARRIAGTTVSAGAAEAGFLPEKQQDTKASAGRPELERVLETVAAGEWEHAAEALAATAGDKNWDLRHVYADALGTAAAEDDGWLQRWQSACPDDPGAALVRAYGTVALAWNVRGASGAEHTTNEQFEGFHRVLAQSRTDIARAASLAPRDPTPYVPETWTALGLGYSREQMQTLWSAVTERDPYNYAAHNGALQYWCAKWRGSEEQAADFAAEAAAAAPRGSLLTALPLISWFEHNDDDAKDRDYRKPEVTAIVDAALEDAEAAAETGHPRLAELRHLLAWFLVQQNRHTAALGQFRLVDGYIDAIPWRYYANPAEVYCAARERAVRGARREALKAGRRRP